MVSIKWVWLSKEAWHGGGYTRRDIPAWVVDVVLGVLYGEVSERVALVTVQAVLHLHGMSR